MSLFKDDPLEHEPGSQFLYTTFGWTLLSAVIENAAKTKFLVYMNQLFKELGMNSTQAELHESLIYGRARYACVDVCCKTNMHACSVQITMKLIIYLFNFAKNVQRDTHTYRE